MAAKAAGDIDAQKRALFQAADGAPAGRCTPARPRGAHPNAPATPLPLLLQVHETQAFWALPTASVQVGPAAALGVAALAAGVAGWCGCLDLALLLLPVSSAAARRLQPL